MERGLEGTVIDGRYVIEEELGRGGMGSIFRGRQMALDRQVAIKVLRADVEHDAVHVERLIREAQALSQIRHPNVVEVIDFGKLDDGSPYIVMEYLDGKDLNAVLQEDGRMSWSRARGILLQVLAGLRAAHRKGVLHRDVKPGNCFLVQEPDAEPGDYVKLVDFGIAKFVTPEHTNEQRRLTQAAYIVGTARYLAPEVYDGAEASVQSDIYAVGVLAYKLLTGQAPFIGRDAYDVLLAARNDPPRPMRQLVPGIMPSVERLVLRALAKQPENRFRDTNAFEAAILEVDAAGRRRASGRTGTVVPGSLGATNEQPVLSREEVMQGGETRPMTPIPGRSERAPTPWETGSAASSQMHGKRSSSMITPIFVSVTIGALAGAAFLVYARWGDTGARASAEAESEPAPSDATVQADLAERVRRRCADLATAGTTVQVQLGVATSGSIERVRVGAPHEDSELARCIEAIVRDAKFQRGEERELGLEVTL